MMIENEFQEMEMFDALEHMEMEDCEAKMENKVSCSKYRDATCHAGLERLELERKSHHFFGSKCF